MATAVGFSAIPVPLSVTSGAQVDCRAMEAKTVTIEGTFTATYQVQISCDPSDSPNANSWTNSGTALTAAGNVFVQNSVRMDSRSVHRVHVRHPGWTSCRHDIVRLMCGH
jgi:hypothetical protein